MTNKQLENLNWTIGSVIFVAFLVLVNIAMAL